MVKCIIVDDEPLALTQLNSYIERIPFLECVKSCSSSAEAMVALKEYDIDVMFLDINMPDITGLQLVRSISNPPKVVFTTAYSEYAIDGFKVDAVDYLLKPFAFEDFLKAANKVNDLCTLERAALISNDEDTYIDDDSVYVKSDYRMLRIPIRSIRYVESMSEYVRIYLEDSSKPVVTLLSMKKVEEVLPKNLFMRVHRSYIVNLNKVKEVSRMHIVYDNKVTIPIGDMYKDKFFEYIDSRYLGK
ncbi:MAG: response regulator transcription factor [Bacteroidaceae bacterium]|nr:response regulator transcription factor [Bacteroidaceae bacterium]